MTDRDPTKESVFEYKDRLRKIADDKAWMMIRNGLRQMLQGVEELKRLPRSFETKKEQGRR